MIQPIPHSLIYPSPLNPRKRVDPDSLAELAREYRTAKAAADLARESVKPAAKASLEARNALVAAMKSTGNPIVVDGRLYRIAGNGQFTEDDVQVLGG